MNNLEKKKDFFADCKKLEKIMANNGALIGHECDEKLLPLQHNFVDGLYIREIFMPKGTLLTSKIHKTNHPYFVMKGEVSVITENGVERIKAPHIGFTKKGTKRVLYIHEDCNWITIHKTDTTNLEEIEKEIISNNEDTLNKIGEAV